MSLPSDLTPGEAAARAGLSVSALHFYEKEGLIRAWRTPGNQRRYDRAALRRLSLIKTAQNLGVPLKEIKAKLANLPHDRAPKKSDWTKLAAEWQHDLKARIERLQRLSDYLEGCIGCGCLSMGACELRNPGDIAASQGPGARFIEEKN